MMTFASINTAIQAEMQLDPGLVSDAERLRFVNDCLSQLGGLNLLEKAAVVDTIDQYPTLPADLVKLKEIYADDVPLTYLTSEYDQDTTGTPFGYVWEGSLLRLYPIATASVELRLIYNYSPTAAASMTSGAVPDLPEGWDMLLVDYACARAHRKNGNYLSYRQYKADYTEALAGKVREHVAKLNMKKKVAGTTTIIVSGDRFIAPS
jgi:hypothetical protein